MTTKSSTVGVESDRHLFNRGDPESIRAVHTARVEGDHPQILSPDHQGRTGDHIKLLMREMEALDLPTLDRAWRLRRPRYRPSNTASATLPSTCTSSSATEPQQP